VIDFASAQRRRHPRYRVYVAVRAESREWEASPVYNGKNISLGGILVALPPGNALEFTVGQPHALTLFVPGNEDIPPLLLNAKVSRVETSAVAYEWTLMSPEARTQLARLIEQLSAKDGS
jgi:hypothetical protein